MKAWLVGGTVRDALMGRPAEDRDWVVVGSTPEAMRAAGFKPVGRDFPVFLHPQTGEEYALARTERKTAPGYHGFVFHAAPEVTLEEDLARRDLTLNAMAQDPETGAVVDPFGGREDLAAGLLRHVGPAFEEDPVRLLRLARFAARWPGFVVAEPTLALARAMVERGEVDALVPERVWQEIARGLMAERPSRMIQVLRDCGALARLAPEVERQFGVPQPPAHHPGIDTGAQLLQMLDMAARLQAPLAVRYSLLVHDLGKGAPDSSQWPGHIGDEARSAQLGLALSRRWRVPADCAELAQLMAREHDQVHAGGALNPAAVMGLLERADALRRPERFEQLLLACECEYRGRAGLEDMAYPPRPRLAAALRAALRADSTKATAAALAAGVPPGPAVGQAVRRCRLQALAAALEASASQGAA